jgi:hypothetical protein
MKETASKKNCRCAYDEHEVVTKFVLLQQRGREPGIDDFLERYPGYSRSLRGLLEGAKLVNAEFQRFRVRYPGVDITRLASKRTH